MSCYRLDGPSDAAHSRCGINSRWEEFMKHIVRALVLLAIAAVPAHAGLQVSLAPEPATIGLVATGIGALGLAAWIKSRRKP